MADLLVRDDGRVRTLTLHRPERRNALSHGLVADLRAALDDVAADDGVRVVVLAGEGKAFCAGADLDAMRALQTASTPDNLSDSEHLAGLFRQIVTHPKPIVGRLHGAAIGGGCGLAAACDISVAEEGLKIGFTEVRLGFVPAIVMVVALRRMGETAVRDLMLRGHLIDGSEAARIGLVTHAVPPDRLDETVYAIAHEIASETSASAIALTKAMLARVPGMGLDEGFTYAAQMNALCRTTPDFQAGIASFLDKTPPPWKG